MSGEKCDLCEFDNADVRASNRRSMVRCDGCEQCLCVECLRQMAIDKELVGVDVNAQEDDAAQYMFRDAESGDELCAECWEAEAD